MFNFIWDGFPKSKQNLLKRKSDEFVKFTLGSRKKMIVFLNWRIIVDEITKDVIPVYYQILQIEGWSGSNLKMHGRTKFPAW